MLKPSTMLSGSALDIGGTRARLYHVQDGAVLRRSEIWLPEREAGEDDLTWGARRVQAIAGLVAGWNGPALKGAIPTACAGRKDEARTSVVLSFYASPLPDLVPYVKANTGIDLGPLYDDDVCAGWGHLVAGHLGPDSPATVVLTAGTGVAESLWVGGSFLQKGSYPRLSDLGLEDLLRTQAWRDSALPLEALEQAVEARQALAPFSRLILSGRFAQRDGWPERLGDGRVGLLVRPLEEAPALGALALSREEKLSA